MRIRVGVLLGLGLLASPEMAAAGAWTMEADRGQAIVTGTMSQTDSVFDNSRDRQAAPRYRKFELQGLLEYGATDWLTLIWTPALQHVDIASPNAASRTGLGYSDFGSRFRLLQGGSWVLSGQTTVRVPGTFERSNPAAIGYTNPEYDMRALFGYGFTAGAWPTFIDLQAAQRFRTGEPPNEFRLDATFGIRPAPNWLLLAQSFNVISQGSGSVLFPAYDYSKLQFSLVYDMTPAWSLQLGAFTTFSGRNALQENGVILGSWLKF